MKKYHKIQTVFLRDPETKYRSLIYGEFATPEFKYLQNNDWIWTEKVDGTNIRVMWDGKKDITFGGKTDQAQIPAYLVNRLNDLFRPLIVDFRNILADTETCLYGEGYGAKIQKGGGNYKRDGQDFVLFDIKIAEWWLERENVEDIAAKLNISIVPIIGTGTLGEMVEFARAGFKSKWGDFMAEGIVARPATELIARDGKRIITKVKHRDFL